MIVISRFIFNLRTLKVLEKGLKTKQKPSYQRTTAAWLNKKSNKKSNEERTFKQKEQQRWAQEQQGVPFVACSYIP